MEVCAGRQGPDLGGIRAPPGPGPSKDCGALKPSPAQKKKTKKKRHA